MGEHIKINQTAYLRFMHFIECYFLIKKLEENKLFNKDHLI